MKITTRGRVVIFILVMLMLIALFLWVNAHYPLQPQDGG